MVDTSLRLALPGEPFPAAARMDWVEKARRYLKRAHDDDAAAATQAQTKRPRKMLRLASYRHGLCLDALLQSALPGGVDLLLPKEGDDQKSMLDLYTWVNVEDSGPIPWSCRMFMQYHLGLRLLPQRDYYHMVWRAILEGFGFAKFKGILYLNGLGHNLAHGPWNGAAWFTQLGESALDYFESSRASCPLFQSLAPRIMRDLGRPGDELDEGAVADLHKMLGECRFLHVRGPRDQISRWASWMKAEDWWTPHITVRLLFLLYLGLQMGYLEKKDPRHHLLKLVKDTDKEVVKTGGTAASSSSAAPSSGVPHQAPMSADAVSVARVRDSCENSMHAATVIYSDERNTEWSRMMLFASTPFTDMLAHWRHFLRDRAQGLIFAIDQATCKSTLAAIHETSCLWKDAAALEKMGFTVSGLVANKTYKALGLSDAFVLNEDEQARRFGQLLLGLAKAFLFNSSEASICYPRKFALFASADAGVRAAALKDFRVFCDAFENVQGNTLPLWKKACKRSCMNLVLVRDYRLRCAAAGWKEVPADIIEHQRRCASSFQATSITEDSFHYIKAEGRSIAPQVLSHCQIWRNPSAKGILNELYKYTEIKPDDLHDQKECFGAKALPESVFRPATKHMTTPALKELPGHGQAPWPTCWPPEQYHGVAEDLLMMRWCHGNQCFNEAPSYWRGVFIQHGVVVKFKQSGIFLSLGCTCTMVALWPLVKTQSVGQTCFALKKVASIDELAFRAVGSFGEWKAIPSRFVSPAHLFVLNKRKLPDTFPELSLLQTGKEMPFLEYAAQQGFWHFKGLKIKKLLQDEWGLQLDPNASDAELLVQAVCAAKGCSPACAADILESRAFVDEEAEEIALLGSEEVQDAMCDEDKKEISQYLDTHQEKLDFSQSMVKAIGAIREKAPKTAAAETRPNGKRKAVSFKPKGHWTAAEASPLFPAGAKVLKDLFNARWRVWMRGYTKSRSWGITGDDEGTMFGLARDAWAHHQALTGEDNPFEDP